MASAFKCDICGVFIEEDDEHNITISSVDDLETDIEVHELCKTCAEKIYNYVGAMIRDAKVQERSG